MAVSPKQGGLYNLNPLAISKTNDTNYTNNSHCTSVAAYDRNPVFNSALTNNAACNPPFLDVLHARLGHTFLSKMKHIADCKSYVSDKFFCEVCVQANSHGLPFNKSYITTNSPFQLVHMDFWGPYRTVNITGAHFFLTLVDGFSKSTWTQCYIVKIRLYSLLFSFTT